MARDGGGRCETVEDGARRRRMARDGGGRCETAEDSARRWRTTRKRAVDTYRGSMDKI